MSRQNDIPQQCPHCRYSTQWDHLNRHLSRVHGVLPSAREQAHSVKRKVCDICDKSIVYNHLARHKRKVHMVEPERQHRRLSRETSRALSVEQPGLGVETVEAQHSDAPHEILPLPTSLSSDPVADLQRDGGPVALRSAVDEAVCEIEAFLQDATEGPDSENLRTKYETILPVLKDNMKGNWMKLDTLNSLRGLFDSAEASNPPTSMRTLCTSNQELWNMKKMGQSLPWCVGCIVIRKDLEMPEVDLATFLCKLVNFHNLDDLEGQNHGKTGTATTSHALQEHLKRYEQRRANRNLRSLRNGQGLPRNVLSLSGELGTHVSLPKCAQILEYGLLDILTLDIRAHNRRKYEFVEPKIVGKEHSEPNWLCDLNACIRFCLFSDRLAPSLSHLDILNGTWVTCLSGYKMWFVYDGPWDEQAQGEFREQGELWMPVGRMKLVLLGPGDTLIMRPGYPIVHAVVTLDDSVMVGGMLWPQHGLFKLAGSLDYITSNPGTTNEYIPKQLPEYLDALDRLARSQVVEGGYARHPITITAQDTAALESLKAKLRPKLSCTCEGGFCLNTCPCSIANSSRMTGCTSWCHPEVNDFRRPDRRCRHPGVPFAGDPGKPTGCNCRGGCSEQAQCGCRSRKTYCTSACHSRSGRAACTHKASEGERSSSSDSFLCRLDQTSSNL
jgi:hypothetical protein